MSKTDPKLGQQVHDHLVKLGIETPMHSDAKALMANPELQMDTIELHMQAIMNTLGLDLTDDSLIETPRRVAKMYVKEVFSGLNYNNFPKCTTVENKFSSTEEFIMESNITLYSDCEHHIRPIIGVAHVAYIPTGGKVLGLSKMNRIVQFFSKRPQVQERLTRQIAEAIAFVTGSQDVAVMIDAKHLCVSQRGVADTNSSTQTISALGRFGEQDSHLRREFVSAIK